MKISSCSILLLLLNACGIYSFTGAAVEGKTINVHFIENRAANVVPSLSPTFTQKLQQKIASQTSLSQVNSDKTDYDLQAYISDYNISVASISGGDVSTSSKNRLTITVNVQFENRKNEKNNFTQSFSRFADFNPSQDIQSVENSLINSITDELSDDIFNKAFVNW
ncbi:MAG TPA: LptE family protein [Chitinophagaceae bacterium]|nr:LptE family protein [Chitinophagaceae bacterium]